MGAVDTIKRLVRWGKVTRASDESRQFPVQQVSYLGKAGNAMMLFPYGHHANIPPETLALLLSVQGSSEAKVALPTSAQERPVALVAGEVVVFHPGSKSRIHFLDSGDIEIKSDTLVKVDAPSVEITEGAVKKLMTEDMISVFNTHNHGGAGPNVTLSAGSHATTKLKAD